MQKIILKNCKQAAKKNKNLIARCWNLESLQGRNKTDEYAELTEHIGHVLFLTEAEEFKTMREVLEAYTDNVTMSLDTKKLLDIMVSGSTVWRYNKTQGAELLS